MTFPTKAEDIVSHISFLLNYLNTLYLLEFVSNNRLVEKLNLESDPHHFHHETAHSTRSSGQDGMMS